MTQGKSKENSALLKEAEEKKDKLTLGDVRIPGLSLELFEKQKRVFLQSLAVFGNVSAAARYIGIAETMPYYWRSVDPDFGEAMEKARAMGNEILADELEIEGHRRGKEKSDLLLMFMLKGLRPHKWREQSLDSGRPISITLEISAPDGRKKVIDCEVSPVHPLRRGSGGGVDAQVEVEVEGSGGAPGPRVLGNPENPEDSDPPKGSKPEE